jgi:hypothetical protein
MFKDELKIFVFNELMLGVNRRWRKCLACPGGEVACKRPRIQGQSEVRLVRIFQDRALYGIAGDSFFSRKFDSHPLLFDLPFYLYVG